MDEPQPSVDFEVFRRLMAALSREGVDYILVGGMAVNLHGILRATEDIDLFLRPSPENVERAKAALREVWDDPAIEEIQAADLTGEYPVVRYGPPEGTLLVDLICRLGEAVAYDDLEAMEASLDGVPVRLATPRTLYWMKRDTVRPRDRADAYVLREKFRLED